MESSPFGGRDPDAHRLSRGRLARRLGGFEHEASVDRLALHGPIVERERKRTLRLVEQIQREIRRLARMRGVVAFERQLEAIP